MQEESKRNPKWTREEIMLALDMYFNVDINKISAANDDVVNLSKLLNMLSAYETGKTSTYRNANGVHMKLMNFRSIETGKGLTNVSEQDRLVFSEFYDKRDYLHSLTTKIIEAINTKQKPDMYYDNYTDEGFMEGAVIERQHKYKERSKKAVQAKKQQALEKKGVLECEVCGVVFETLYGAIGSGYIQCHHVIPLSDIEIRQETKLNDLSLVCSNCHCMLHRKRPWMTIKELRSIMQETKTKVL